MGQTSGDFMLIITPLLLSFLVTGLTGKVGSGYRKAWFQPPGYVFGVVWTALYIMFGFLLYHGKHIDDKPTIGLVCGTIALTYVWQYFFSYLKDYKTAIFIIFLTLLIGLELLVRLIVMEWEDVYLYIYVPFISWIIFALLLSAFSGKKKLDS